MNDIIKAILPTLANALLPGAGVLVGVAESFLANKMGVPADKVQETLAGMKPEDIIKMKDMDIEFQKFCLDNGIKIQMAQIAVNTEEAKSDSVFVAGWRPFVGWCGGVGFAYATIIEPLMRFFAQVVFHYAGQFPVIDTMLTMQVLFGILGLAGMRSYDKKVGNGKESGKA